METENRSWIVQVYDALEKKEAHHAPSQLLIWKVPSKYRTNAKYYEPQHWQFGLHHCSQSLDSNDIEGFKVELARAVQLTGDRWDSFCQRVVLEPKEYWEAVYRRSPHANSYTIEEIKCRLALDALFLVLHLQWEGRGVNSLGPELQKVLENPVLDVYMNSLRQDLRLVENQIPLELLTRVVGILVTEYEDYVGEMQEWESEDWQFWNIGAWVQFSFFLDPQMNYGTMLREFRERRMNDWLGNADFYRGDHILDSTYRMLCGRERASKRFMLNIVLQNTQLLI